MAKAISLKAGSWLKADVERAADSVSAWKASRSEFSQATTTKGSRTDTSFKGSNQDPKR
jgi:hypothetical protein